MRTARIVTVALLVGLLTTLVSACGSDASAGTTAATGGAQTTATPPATATGGTATTGTATTGTGATEVRGGTTTLTLDARAADALDAVGVTVGAAAPATAEGATVQFPVTGGTLTTTPLGGVVDHDGALRLSALGRKVDLARPRVDLGAGTLSAEVGGRRVPLFDLATDGADVTQAGGATRVNGIGVSVAAEGARALGDALGVDVLRDGLALGTLTVRVEG